MDPVKYGIVAPDDSRDLPKTRHRTTIKGKK
jgi:hypothetical protein